MRQVLFHTPIGKPEKKHFVSHRSGNRLSKPLRTVRSGLRYAKTVRLKSPLLQAYLRPGKATMGQEKSRIPVTEGTYSPRPIRQGRGGLPVPAAPVGGTQPPAGTAGTQRASSSGQPPVGSSQPTIGTAWARRPPGSSQHPGEDTQPMTDMAGAQRASDPSRPPVGGTQPPVGTAGTRQPSGPSRPSMGGTQPQPVRQERGSPPVPAGLPWAAPSPQPVRQERGSPPVPAGLPWGGTQPPAGTAGTQRAAGPSRPPIGGHAGFHWGKGITQNFRRPKAAYNPNGFRRNHGKRQFGGDSPDQTAGGSAQWQHIQKRNKKK